MAFKRTFRPAIINSSNVKGLSTFHSEELVDGTVKSNTAAEGDLCFWIPLPAPHLCEGVPRVRLLA